MIIPALTLLMALSSQAAAQAQTDTSQMSLAERAAASRKGPAPTTNDFELTPAQRGSVRQDKYVNDFFHFELTKPEGWEIYSQGRMNVNEAVGRAYLDQKAGFSSAGRVLGLGDGTGQSIYVSIIRVPAGEPTDVAEIGAKMKKVIHSHLPMAKDLKETVDLSSPQHPFAGLRYMLKINDTELFQNLQWTICDGNLITFTTTGSSEQNLANLLQLLGKHISWKTPSQ
ncbi:MAG TPA: hypothetical protein VEW69_13055 [Alphaproteobacteria bacterium]|nr:hypothetical protein [Alphaproteobacteria bacterium]